MSGGKMRDASTDIPNRLGLDGRECYDINNNIIELTIFYLKHQR